jgi:hypothetical protein
MITIAEVIEQCAQTVEGFDGCDPKYIAARIRALAAQYEGCIVAEGHAVASMWQYIGPDPLPFHSLPTARSFEEMNPLNPEYPDSWKATVPLYRARETQR